MDNKNDLSDVSSQSGGESVTLIDLGTGTSFDVSGYPGYENFTVDNFYIQPSDTVNTSNHGTEDASYGAGSNYGVKSLSASINVSYDSSTGTLTASLSASATGGYQNIPHNWQYYRSASGSVAVHAYLAH